MTPPLGSAAVREYKAEVRDAPKAAKAHHQFRRDPRHYRRRARPSVPRSRGHVPWRGPRRLR